MITREVFTWDCVLLDAQTQQVEEYEFRSYWDPTKVDLNFVAVSAAAEAGYVAGKITKQPVSAEVRS